MPSRNPPIVLSISGSDPSGGAGIEADLKTFHQHGVYGMAIPTLLTAQNTVGVQNIQFLNPDFLEEQWNAIFADLCPNAIKIGALGSRDMVLRIAKLLSKKEAKGIPIVLDPVIPPALDGLKATLRIAGSLVEITYHIKGRGCGIVAVEWNGTPLEFTREANPYRSGAVRIAMDAITGRFADAGGHMAIHLD